MSHLDQFKPVFPKCNTFKLNLMQDMTFVDMIYMFTVVWQLDKDQGYHYTWEYDTENHTEKSILKYHRSPNSCLLAQSWLLNAWTLGIGGYK